MSDQYIQSPPGDAICPTFSPGDPAVLARNGMVATSQPLAAVTGLRVLMDGGNAVDAAVATAAALNVVEPASTGVGGDMFALIWMANEKRVVALNGSGRSAAAANAADVTSMGYDAIPKSGRDAGMSVSVPGTVHGWETAIKAYGRMSLQDVLQPAIDYAINGYPVSEVIAHGWKGTDTPGGLGSESKLRQRPSGLELLPTGEAPVHGDVVRLPTLGRTLQTIAEGGSEAFYKGDISQRIATYVRQSGGWLVPDDLAAHHSDWDEPISTDYRGVTVWECPPNGQGIGALMALNLGFADALRYVADPRVTDVPIDALLSKEYAGTRRDLIGPSHVVEKPVYGDPLASSDTVYLTAVDGEGNACSLINSLYQGFGSGLVVPNTGIALQNRGSLFSLDPDHPNYLQGGKRPYQTIIRMATREGEFWLSFGVMGGFQQPQGHLQVISNMVDFGMNSQQALDALRFVWTSKIPGTLASKRTCRRWTINELRRRGHTIEVKSGYDRTGFGGGQVIARDPETGVLTGGSEPRKDGAAVGW
ncbi:Glutathione hydrolase-like YwrD proenzyme [Geodia barretti]|uniref:Glutathione hydrolase-like YwrD proenzyme n=1 Tax=Geodia barretti TaxID=519541 RepID=A0AA35W5N1_GEOBA|nr:Glutathione hydrolase-like YwrD proenzyme [Geodia barretti]